MSAGQAMRIFFVDESGDQGWGRDSSPFLVLLAVGAREPNLVRKAVARLHRQFNVKDELKCSTLSREERIRAIKLLQGLPIRYFAVAIDKKAFQRHFPEHSGKPKTIYSHALQTLFNLIVDNACDEPRIIIDEPRRPGVPREMLQSLISLAKLPPDATFQSGPEGTLLRVPMKSTRIVRQVTGFVKSDQDLGIQAADLLAGVLRQCLIEHDLRLKHLLRKLEGGFILEPEMKGNEVAVHARLEAMATLRPGSRRVTWTQADFALKDPD